MTEHRTEKKRRKPKPLAIFLDRFDAYVHARAQLRSAEDGSEEAHQCIGHCASLWNLLCDARKEVTQ